MKLVSVLLAAAASAVSAVGVASALRSDVAWARALVEVLALLPGVLVAFGVLLGPKGQPSGLGSWGAFDARLRGIGGGRWAALILVQGANAAAVGLLARVGEWWAEGVLGFLALLAPAAVIGVLLWRSRLRVLDGRAG